MIRDYFFNYCALALKKKKHVLFIWFKKRVERDMWCAMRT